MNTANRHLARLARAALPCLALAATHCGPPSPPIELVPVSTPEPQPQPQPMPMPMPMPMPEEPKLTGTWEGGDRQVDVARSFQLVFSGSRDFTRSRNRHYETEGRILYGCSFLDVVHGTYGAEGGKLTVTITEGSVTVSGCADESLNKPSRDLAADELSAAGTELSGDYVLTRETLALKSPAGLPVLQRK